ncbi:DUF7146 domain-containing protein [Vannielia litorea]|uniref:DUF7146 domain-containing protein n=1 Tax=Vannielia litorea TaxID=1217970 RepID=UPI001BCF09A1|nr:hypothetical protein [Vannielia litorea]MBS8228183.1 hypothetical protein [Vannielia litorea]
MTHAEDPRLEDAKRKPVAEVLEMLRFYDLRQTPNRREMSGPCVACGSAGHSARGGPVDRFNINTDTGAFFCRKCDIRGGDVIALVREAKGLSFPDALTFLCGELLETETPEQKAAREERQRKAREKAAEDERKRKAAEASYRARAIADARRIWNAARPGHLGVVAAYLRARGIEPANLPFPLPEALRFIAQHPYMKQLERGKPSVELWRGPAMIAGVLRPEGTISAVHQTWVSPEPPHGKATITHGGEAFPAKMMRGSKKGGAIRLHTPEGAHTLVMAEGIENTLTAALAWGETLPGAAYWCGADLGNMAGKMQKVEGTRSSGLPDMEDTEAFVPPPWVKRLILVKDGDSHPATTQAKLQSCARRAMALIPGLKAEIVPAPPGFDMNDVLRGKGPVAEESETQHPEANQCK